MIIKRKNELSQNQDNKLNFIKYIAKPPSKFEVKFTL